MNKVSIFKRLDSKHFSDGPCLSQAQKDYIRMRDKAEATSAVAVPEEKGKIVTVKTHFYGKPMMFKLLSREIVRYRADLISKRLEIKNGKYCTLMRNAIESGMCNAEYKGLSREKMYIKSISVGRGTYLKRRHFKGKGRSGLVRRPFSNLFIELKEVSVG